MEYYRIASGIQSFDRITLGICLGIAAANEHNTGGGARVDNYFALVEIALCYSLEEVDYVGLNPQHNAFGFRVAHSAIVFYYHWVIGYVDKTEEDESFIVDAVGFQTVDGWANYSAINLLHPLLGGKWHGRYASHAARVESGIVFTNSFIVFRLGQNLVVSAIGEHEHRAFRSI